MKTVKEEKPLYLGHRERLRTRFLKDNGASMDDYEILELLLTLSIPRRDVKPLAKKILAAYKDDLGSVLHASAKELAENFKLSASTIASFKLITTCATRMASSCFAENNSPVFTNLDSIIDFCRNEMAYLDVEEFRAFFLDQQYRYISQEVLSRGTINRAYVTFREITHYALDAKAVHVILCHNHPSGDCTPSAEDKRLTAGLCEHFASMDIDILDHIIISKRDVFSFASSGLIPCMAVKEKLKQEKQKKMLAK